MSFNYRRISPSIHLSFRRVAVRLRPSVYVVSLLCSLLACTTFPLSFFVACFVTSSPSRLASMASLTMAAQAIAPSTFLTLPTTPICKPSNLQRNFNVRIGTRSRNSVIVSLAAPKGSSGPAINNLNDTLAQSIDDAQQVCAGDEESEECAAAWDEVENVSATVAHQKDKNKGTGDPLEEYCETNPDADECRVYND